MRRVLSVVAAGVALVAAGCTTVESATTLPPPSSVATLLASTTTAPSPTSTSPSTTIRSESTTPAAPPPTTTPVTPTTLAPSPLTHLAATRLCVLGWWDGRDWVQNPTWEYGAEPATLPAGEGDRFGVATLTGTSLAVGASLYDAGLIDSLWGIELDPILDWRSGVAVSGSLDLIPRPVRELPLDVVDYTDDTKELLAGLGLTGVGVRITKALLVDLDGDGLDEIVYSAEHPGLASYTYDDGPDGFVPVGYYSLLVVRHIAGRAIQSDVLYQSLALESREGYQNILVSGEINAVADLNGDGAMEIVVSTAYYEGSFDVVYEYTPAVSEPDPVMLCGRGA